MSRPLDPRRAVSRVIAGVAALVLGLLSLIVGISPAYASGDVKGTLVDQLGHPVLGLTFDVWSSSSGTLVSTVTSDATTGDFDLALADGGYYYWVHDGATDAGSNSYGNSSESFFISGADTDLHDLVLEKYVDVSGTITNWTVGMGNVHVQIKNHSGGSWFTLASGTSTGASFTIPATLEDGDYTLYFQLDSSSTAPYLDAFLGGELYDPDNADTVTAVAGTPITDILMAMPDAALITGTVTDASTGLPLAGIDVSTEDRPGEQYFADFLTDSSGDYTLRVVPGLTYAVYADDPNGVYASLTYDDLDPCGCVFTPVNPTLAAPSGDIDFALTADLSSLVIEGVLLDGSISGSPASFDGVKVHLYKPVTGGWSEVDVAQSDSSGQFEVHLPALGSYRLRFESSGVWLPVIDGLVGTGSATSPDPATPGCVVDTGPLDASSVSFTVAYYVIAGLDDAGGCAAEPALPGSSGTGTSSSGHRSHPASTTDTVLPVTLPTPTPTPTATPSPSPSASSGDSVSTPKPIAPAPAVFDLTWLWILLGVLLALVILFFVIWVVRARRA